MCEEAKTLIIGYLNASEECDRLHLVFLAASRRTDPQATEGYCGLFREAKVKLEAARRRFQEHPKTHECCESISFQDD
jgi:hypothetical protein